MQSSQWIGKDLLDQKKKKNAWMSRSKIKLLLVVFFDWKGIVHLEFVPRGKMVNKQLYQEVLARWGILCARRGLNCGKTRIGQCASSRVAPHPRFFLAKHQTSVVPHPPYSPDLAPEDFFLFPKIYVGDFRQRFQQWQRLWDRCTQSQGEYCEGN
jgi:histone-lysine N-methyltransferase SETMAR